MFYLALLTTALVPPLLATAALSSPKRGLCYVTPEKDSADNQIWFSGPSPPTWYYNYQSTPTAAYAKTANLQFVPMLWGASASDTGTPFLDSVTSQHSSGANISYVLGFNEPDGPMSTGGSNISPALAALRWKAEIEPLKKLGIKLGAPGVTGAASGWTWLDAWFTACDGGCNPDFMPVHWYGNFEGMMSHVGQVVAKYPHLSVWVTEFGFPNQKLEATQQFWNQSAGSFDAWSNITHYSYFGAFRSDVSGVGANAAMLTESGKLTDIGSWYIGGAATHNVPKSSSDRVGSSSSLLYLSFAMALWVVFSGVI